MTRLHQNILMCSHRKTGQHWFLFLLASYHKLVRGDQDPHVSWYEIGQFSKLKLSDTILAPHQQYYQDFPRLIRVEYSRAYSINVRKFFDSFDKRIYMYRDPGDVLVSMFYYFMRDPFLNHLMKGMDLKNHEYFEEFVRYNMENYISHVEVSIDHCDIVLHYDSLRKDPSLFKEALLLFHEEIDDSLFQKALDLASFENSRKKEEMEIQEEKHVFHARDGRCGKYKEIMNASLIEYIQEKWNDLKKRIKYPIL